MGLLIRESPIVTTASEKETFSNIAVAWLASFGFLVFALSIAIIAYNVPISTTNLRGLCLYMIVYSLVGALQSVLMTTIIVSFVRLKQMSVAQISSARPAVIGFIAAAGPWLLLLLVPSSTGLQVGNDVLVSNGYITVTGLMRLMPEIFVIGVIGAGSAWLFYVVLRRRVQR